MQRKNYIGTSHDSISSSTNLRPHFAPIISFLLSHRENASPYDLGEPDLWCSLRSVLNYPPGLVQVLWCSHAGEKLSVLFRVAVENLKEVGQMGMMKYARTPATQEAESRLQVLANLSNLPRSCLETIKRG